MVKSSAAFPRACEEITDCDKIMQLDSADLNIPPYLIFKSQIPCSVCSEITASSQALSTLILSESIIYLVITGNCEGRPHFNVTETQNTY